MDNNKHIAPNGTNFIYEIKQIVTQARGKGFSVNSLYYFRQFYTTFPQIFPTMGEYCRGLIIRDF